MSFDYGFRSGLGRLHSESQGEIPADLFSLVGRHITAAAVHGDFKRQEDKTGIYVMCYLLMCLLIYGMCSLPYSTLDSSIPHMLSCLAGLCLQPGLLAY